MTDPTSFASTYYLEVQWALMWFPIREHPDLPGPVVRNGTIEHSSTEYLFRVGNGEVHWLGEPGRLPPLEVAAGFATVYPDPADHRLTVTFQIDLGKQSVSRKLDAPPGQRIPFMLNIGEGRGKRSEGTALSLWGTIVTSGRLGPMLTDSSLLGEG